MQSKIDCLTRIPLFGRQDAGETWKLTLRMHRHTTPKSVLSARDPQAAAAVPLYSSNHSHSHPLARNGCQLNGVNVPFKPGVAGYVPWSAITLLVTFSRLGAPPPSLGIGRRISESVAAPVPVADGPSCVARWLIRASAVVTRRPCSRAFHQAGCLPL
jgi:hypothetical protein